MFKSCRRIFTNVKFSGFQTPSNLQFRRPLVSVQPVAKRRKWPYVLLLTAGCAYGYWKYITYHRFPPPVADLLKEGLMATINGAGYRKPDFRKALGKYIDALIEADKLEMVPFSDEYTGIQFLIADLYERLDLPEEATAMYLEVASVYLMALQSNKIPENNRTKIISRDLRVALLAALLMSTKSEQLPFVAEFLLPHIHMAQMEAVKENDKLKMILEEPNASLDSIAKISADPKLSHEFESCFNGFKNELFTLMEMIVGIESANGNYLPASLIKSKTTRLMMQSGFPMGECMLSAVNVGNLLFLNAMNMRYSPMGVNARAAEAVDKQIKQNSTEDVKNGNKQPSYLEVEQKFLDTSSLLFDNAIKTIEKLDERRTSFLPEAYVMALYGRGVVATSVGDFKMASDLFSEARLRAKGTGVQSLIESVEEELKKVEKLKSLDPEELKKLDPENIPSLNIMYWKQSPEVSDRPELPEIPH